MPFFYPTTPFQLTGKTLVIVCNFLVSIKVDPPTYIIQVARGVYRKCLAAGVRFVDRFSLPPTYWGISSTRPRSCCWCEGRWRGGRYHPLGMYVQGYVLWLDVSERKTRLVFGKEGVDILVIQQRSPALKSRKQEYIDSLLGFIQSSGVAAVLFISGVDLSNRTDTQMLTPTYYIHPANTPALAESVFSSISQLPIPVYTSPVQQHIHEAPEGDIPFIPGGGLTRRMLSSIPSLWSIPTVALLQFAIEGDNRADAHLLAAVTAKVLGVDSFITEWKQPGSWKQGLFGTPPDQALYG